ncbi:MAG TPA: DUF481 domain-containing protein [bacterium]|nr:DUF481 domain-containing protein [bacterium]
MKNILSVAAMAAFSLGAMAQDKITLANGDVITGKIVSMADGKVVIHSPVLNDVTVPIADVQDMVTGAPVTLKTREGDLWDSRIVGIENASLRLEGGDSPSLALDNLGMINPPADKPEKWTGSLKFTGINSTGNTNRRAAGLMFEASRKSGDNRYSVDASWDYAEDKRQAPQSGYVITQRRVGAGGKWDHYLSERSYALVTARVLGDTIANLDRRLTGGVGYGYTFIDDGKELLLVEIGVSYFDESYRVVAPGQVSSRESVSARIAYRYETPLSETTKFVHRAEAYPSLEDQDDFYCQVVTELTTSLTDNMVASISHVLDYDNTPAPGFVRDDQRVIVSVGWSF